MDDRRFGVQTETYKCPDRREQHHYRVERSNDKAEVSRIVDRDRQANTHQDDKRDCRFEGEGRGPPGVPLRERPEQCGAREWLAEIQKPKIVRPSRTQHHCKDFDRNNHKAPSNDPPARRLGRPSCDRCGHRGHQWRPDRCVLKQRRSQAYSPFKAFSPPQYGGHGRLTSKREADVMSFPSASTPTSTISRAPASPCP